MAVDASGKHAHELALDTVANSDERTHLACCLPRYIEPIDAGKSRRIIASRLQALFKSRMSSSVKQAQRQPDLFFQRRDRLSLAICVPSTVLSVPHDTPQKALACLDRGQYYPKINFISGREYPGASWRDGVDNKVWSAAALEIGQLCLHLKDINMDQACHVEPQALAYLIHKHTLLGLVGEQDYIDALRKVSPPLTINPVVIVNRRMCATCSTYLNAFNQALTREKSKLRVTFKNGITNADAGLQIRT
jgi:hypothetical protein